MDQFKSAIRAMIRISETEMEDLAGRCQRKTFSKKSILSSPFHTPNEVFFLNAGLVRVFVTDRNGIEHTIHFALENQFIADYSCFIRQEPSHYTLQALEETEVVVMPRQAIEWGYKNLVEGDKLGRLIAEYYFIYQDDRIKNQYVRTPKERYEAITEVFPNIHNRVPQHMIASYLGITPVHLSRLKKDSGRKS